jgi:hypothetical protein
MFDLSVVFPGIETGKDWRKLPAVVLLPDLDAEIVERPTHLFGLLFLRTE